MRLIGGVRPPSNTILLRQFQQCQVNKTSSTRLHPVLIEASSFVNDGRSYATSAPSDAIQARKPKRRVTKNERKSMVENYVKNYRETNAGKFPTTTNAMKDTGGSYYTVRQILQELIHNSKQPTGDTKETSLKKSTTENDKISANIKERYEDSTFKSNGKQGQQSSVLKEASINEKASIFQQTDKSEDVGTQFHPSIGKPESSQLPDPENNINQENHKNKLQQESTEVLGRESQKVPTGDAEPQTSLSVWNNLKSFANGIINLWKRS